MGEYEIGFSSRRIGAEKLNGRSAKVVKIEQVSIFGAGVDLAFTFELSMGRIVSTIDTTIVKIECSDGTVGWGEVCPFGRRYSEAFAEGARAALDVLSPSLLGANPLEIDTVLQRMEMSLSGHGYAKSALELACWDAIGKIYGQPLYALLGGRLTDRMPVAASVHSKSEEEMIAYIRSRRSEGYVQFSPKIDGFKGPSEFAKFRRIAEEKRPGELMSVDANTSLSLGQAAQLVAELRDTRVMIEQPCKTYEECLSIRRRTDLPMILDECIASPSVMYRAHADEALDVLNLKISRIGGLSIAKHLVGFCANSGIDIWIEETAGTEISAAAIAHLATATPSRICLGGWYPPEILTDKHGDSDLVFADGHVTVKGEKPGLGVEPSPGLTQKTVSEYC